MDDENLKIIACDPIKNVSMKWEEISKGILKCEMNPLHWYEIILTYHRDDSHVLLAEGLLFDVQITKSLDFDRNEDVINTLTRTCISNGDVQYLTHLVLKEYCRGL